MLFRSVLARGKEIEPKDLPVSVMEGGAGKVSALKTTGLRLEELEGQTIEAALRKTNRNITEAAKLLGISRRTLHRKLVDLKGAKA